jgi:rsbT co-antagonist protein RsbR
MTADADDLAGMVVQHLVAIVSGNCTIVEEEIRTIAESGDQARAEILSGLLYLHQDLVHRERERLRAEGELTNVVERLSAQNEELERNRSQLEALAAELATPVIRVWDGVIMLPLVGNLDTQRGSEVAEKLLSAIVAEQAEYAILDITGVKSLDTEAADQFVRIVRSIELLGARAILAGVSPGLAVTITGLGVDLAGITTVRNLQQALLRAMDAPALTASAADRPRMRR